MFKVIIIGDLALRIGCQQHQNTEVYHRSRPWSNLIPARLRNSSRRDSSVFREGRLSERFSPHDGRCGQTRVKVRRMNFKPEYLTYYVSQLDINGERIDISPNFKYLTEKEIQVCTCKIAVRLAKLQYKANRITESLQDPKTTQGFPRTWLENKLFTL